LPCGNTIATFNEDADLVRRLGERRGIWRPGAIDAASGNDLTGTVRARHDAKRGQDKVAGAAADRLRIRPGSTNQCGSVEQAVFDLSRIRPARIDRRIAVWNDGVVTYFGEAGVVTVGRRQHSILAGAMAELAAAIRTSGFFGFDDEYTRPRPRKPDDAVIEVSDHSAEIWISVRQEGRRKTVHDFAGAPDALRAFEATVERIADSRRYTGR
jgi:hypothetical protein